MLQFKDLNCKQSISLVGVEDEGVLDQIDVSERTNSMFILPPYPRKMGVSLPSRIKLIAKELGEIEFTNSSLDSPFVVALQTALDLGVTELFLVGFDGYDIDLNKNQFVLAQENQNIINDALKIGGFSVKSISPTKYENIELTSIYSLI